MCLGKANFDTRDTIPPAGIRFFGAIGARTSGVIQLDAFNAAYIFCVSDHILVQAVLRCLRRKRHYLVFYPDADRHFLAGVAGFNFLYSIVDSSGD